MHTIHLVRVAGNVGCQRCWSSETPTAKVRREWWLSEMPMANTMGVIGCETEARKWMSSPWLLSETPKANAREGSVAVLANGRCHRCGYRPKREKEKAREGVMNVIARGG